MRKLKLILLGGLLVLPFAPSANADDTGKITYKEGTRLEFSDFDIKFNVQLQPRFTYQDLDSEGREDLGGDSVEDTSSFKLRRARLIASGNLGESDQFSYKWQFDMASDNGGGGMKDAFIQWNGDPAKLRFGQFKVPYSREENVSSQNLFFIDRSLVNNEFSFFRDTGVMAHGSIGGAGHWYTGLFNGNSDNEGEGRPGVDNNLNWSSMIDFSSDNFGSRAAEGDLRETTDLGWTAGVSFLYGEGEGAIAGDDTTNFDQYSINGDVAVRVAGAEIQAEVHHRNVSLDDATVDGEDEAETTGFYLQGTYIMDKEIGLGARFGYIEPDSDISDIDDQQEYSLVLNYYLMGTRLVLQNEVTFEVTNFEDDDVTDFRYELQLAGYF